MTFRLTRVLLSLGMVAALPVLGAGTVAAAPVAASAHAPFHAAGRAPALLRGRSNATNAARATGLAPPTAFPPTAPGGAAATSGSNAPLIASTQPESLTSFYGTTFPTATALYGSDQEQPVIPDDSIAVGPADIVEVANESLFVFSKSGVELATADLNDFMDVPSLFHISDPKIIYDPSSGRFWIAATVLADSLSFEYDCSQTAPVLLAVSASSNPLPLSGWLVYALPTGTLTPGFEWADQVGLGADSNTIAVTFDDNLCGGPFSGSEVHILQKTDYEHDTGNDSDNFFVSDDTGPYQPQPAQEYGSVSAQYVITDQSNCGSAPCTPPSPDVEVDTFTGTPEGAGGVTASGTDIPVAQTTAGVPPFPATASQPGSGAPDVQTDAGRFINAVWEGGALWAGEAVTCTPSGDTQPRSCLDYVEVDAGSTGTFVPTLTTEITNVGVNGAYLYFPAVSVDSSGNMFTVFDESSATMSITMLAASVAAGASSLSGFETLHTSSTFYNGADVIPEQCTNGCRLGDSSAAQDPTNPKDVWVASAAADGIEGGDCHTLNACWESVISQITVAAPTITSLTPSSGPVAGGQTVTVKGLDFAPDTTATFNASPITVSSLTPTAFTLVTPAHATTGGSVQVQAADGLGSTTENASSMYTYVGLANYVPITPFRLLDTRSGGGGGALAPGAVRALQVTGVGASPIPSSATAVVLNVTEVSGSASSLLTVYPFGTSRPNASNLNFAARTVIANLVTVTLGAQGAQGAVNIYNALGSVNVVADVEGYFAPQPASDVQGLFHPIAPVRVCDTRHGSPTPICSARGAMSPETAMVVDVAGASGIPGDGTAEAAVVNVTGVAGTAPTYLSLFPTNASGGCTYTGTHAPPFSTINLPAGAVQANRVMVELGPTGVGGNNDALCVYNAAGSINVLIDANGWFGSAAVPSSPPGYQYQAVAPTRICDTRVVSASCAQGAVGPAATVAIDVAGKGGIPAAGGATRVVAIIANLTAVAPSLTTFLTLYPADLVRRPTVSDLNVDGGVVLPNLAVVQLDTSGDAHDGDIYLYNSAGVANAIVDIEGWFQ
jgi:hypothetical protein